MFGVLSFFEMAAGGASSVFSLQIVDMLISIPFTKNVLLRARTSCLTRDVANRAKGRGHHCIMPRATACDSYHVVSCSFVPKYSFFCAISSNIIRDPIGYIGGYLVLPDMF